MQPNETPDPIGTKFVNSHRHAVCVIAFVHGMSPRQGKFVARGCLVKACSCIFTFSSARPMLSERGHCQHMSLTQLSHVYESTNVIYCCARFANFLGTWDKFPVTQVNCLGLICLQWGILAKERTSHPSNVTTSPPKGLLPIHLKLGGAPVIKNHEPRAFAT